MKRISLLLLAALGLSGINQATAQIQKDNIMVGANITSFDIGFQNGTSVNFKLNPQVGYFIQDNIAIGGIVNLGVDYKKNSGTTVTYGVGAFGRYYVSSKQMQLLKHTRFFGEANIGISGENNKVDGSPSRTTNGLGIGIGPGISYFITPNIGLEALAKYNLTAGFGSSATVNRLSFGVGFQIYLPTKKARAVYEEASGEVREKMNKGKKKSSSEDDE